MDLADLVAYFLSLGRGVADLASGAGRPVQIVVEAESGTPAWLPYAQAIGAFASAIAVLVAIFVPTRIQKRALTHDREARVNDDARRALFSYVDAAQKYHATLLKRRKWALKRHELEALRAAVDAGKRMAPKGFASEWDFVQATIVAEKEALEDARRGTNLVQLYFPITTEVGAVCSTTYASLARASLSVSKYASSAGDERGPLADAMQAAFDAITELGDTISGVARGGRDAHATVTPITAAREKAAREGVRKLDAEMVNVVRPIAS